MILKRSDETKEILPYPNCGHVVLADPAPILLYPV